MSKLGTYVKFGRDLWRSARWKRVVARGPDAVVVALYFMTAPNSNMTGIFEATAHDICRYTRLPPGRVSAAIKSLEEEAFCMYDHDREYVWEVGALARFQSDRPNANQIKGMRNSFARLAELEDAPFVSQALDYLNWQDEGLGDAVAPDGEPSFDRGS